MHKIPYFLVFILIGSLGAYIVTIGTAITFFIGGGALLTATVGLIQTSTKQPDQPIIPFGYQDRTGFHYGTPARGQETDEDTRYSE